jgi:hypothetical protein
MLDVSPVRPSDDPNPGEIGERVNVNSRSAWAHWLEDQRFMTAGWNMGLYRDVGPWMVNGMYQKYSRGRSRRTRSQGMDM